TLSPVALRNHQLFDRWSVARSGSGASLLEAWGPWADGGPGMEKIVWPPVPRAADEFARDQIYRQVAVDWARQHTSAVIRLAAIKAARTWSVVPNATGYTRGIFALLGWVTVAPLYLFSLMGLVGLTRYVR